MSTGPSPRVLVGIALDLLSQGLHDLVDEVMTGVYGTSEWNERWAAAETERQHRHSPLRYVKNDLQVQLLAITMNKARFKHLLSESHLAHASELREVRNRWAHQARIDWEDAVRTLDTAERLLRAAGATEFAERVRDLRLAELDPPRVPSTPPLEPEPPDARVEPEPPTPPAEPELPTPLKPPKPEPIDEHGGELLAPHLPEPLFQFSLAEGYELGDVDRFVSLLTSSDCSRANLVRSRDQTESVRFHRVQRSGYLPADVDSYVRDVLAVINRLLGA